MIFHVSKPYFFTTIFNKSLKSNEKYYDILKKKKGAVQAALDRYVRMNMGGKIFQWR